MKKLKLFKVDFEGMYPVPCGLIILADDINQATEIAKQTIQHKTSISITEVLMDAPKIVFYENGDY